MSAKTVIVADADMMRVAKLTPALMSMGYSMMRVTKGETVLKICSETDISLVLTQVLLTDMNGISLAQKLMEIAPDTKCLLMSDIDQELITRLPGCETLRSQFVSDLTSPDLIADCIAAALKPRSMTAGN